MSIVLPEVAVMMTALAIGGFVKGVTGWGLPLIAVPVMAGFLGVEKTVIVMVIPAAVLNAWLAWTHRDQAHEVGELPRLLVWACPGAAIGAWILVTAAERMLSTFLAVWIAAYLVVRFTHPELTLSEKARRRLSPGVGLLAGGFQASTGISAPIVATYFHALALQPRAYVFAVSTPFSIIALVHFGALFAFDAYTPQVLGQSALTLIPAFASTWLGARLARRIDQRLFNRMILSLLLLSLVKLLYEAWLSSG